MEEMTEAANMENEILNLLHTEEMLGHWHMKR